MIILAVLLIGPLLIPIPPLEDTRLPRELADPDSLFIEVNGIEIHYKRMGQGEPFILLLHGFGASVYSWREVMAPLSQYGTVIAYDRPAFGLSARPLPGEWSGANPYSMDSQVDLVFSLMDALGIQQAILAGHSAGGVLAVAAALHDPQRVTGLILVDAAVYASGGPPGWIRPLLNAPQFDRLGPWFVRSLAGEQGTAFLQAAWHDPGKISADVMEGYRKPLQVENWDIALWEFTKANRGRDYSAQLVDVHQPALVITGDDDRIVPSEESNRLANDLPNADLVIISACGHLPQEEKPGEFMVAVVKYLQANQWIK
jgi:pimeloyl-ACP methyl ester carboxylesterase